MATGPPIIVLVPGNGGGGDMRRHNYYGWLEHELLTRGYEVRLPAGGQMRDALLARRSIWLPQIVDEILEGSAELAARAVIVGHSSGAVAAMRLAEQTRLCGIVVVAGYDSDLGDKTERASGYFDDPFDFAAMRANAGRIVLIAGTDDDLVPFELQRELSTKLCPTAFVVVEGGDHFFDSKAAKAALLEAVLAHFPHEA
eukprot:a1035_24.p1 GENE.a1035_24~~a1035_24.p1  ORF type:complete len:208 (-),score=65.36 a1035_24:289-885(-)